MSRKRVHLLSISRMQLFRITTISSIRERERGRERTRERKRMNECNHDFCAKQNEK